VLGHDGEISRRARTGAEPLCDPAVGCLARGQHLGLVGGIPQQTVPEPVAAQPDRADRFDDAGVLQPEQRLVDRSPGQLEQRVLVELGAERGRKLDDSQVDAGCAKAGRQQFVEARREHFTGRGGQGAARQLPEEEGDATPALGDEADAVRDRGRRRSVR
jgi:hypothetical protein